jgi:hypothetical protein
MERVPEFWEWLEYHGEKGQVKVPVEVLEEVKDGEDSVARWVRTSRVRDQLILGEEVDRDIVTAVVTAGYAADLTDDEILKVGRDPFLVAYGFVGHPERCIVTTEVSRPSRQRANRHIPDVCRDLGVPCCNTFELTRALDFSTRWRRTSG